MPIRYLNFLIAFVILLTSPALSKEFDFNSQRDQQIQKFTLDNGLTVLVSSVPTSKAVGVYALVKTGSATEGKYLGSGISHFVEHMLFKGTKKREVGQVGKEVKGMGGIINASTSFDYTIYFVEIPKEHFANGVDVVADMVMNATFDEEQFNSERDVIFGEMRLHKDRPARKLSRMILENAFTRHPYQHPVIGYEEVFGSITRNQLVDYYKTHYVPNNIIFSVGGDLKASEVVPQIAEVFKDFESTPSRIRNLPQEPDQVGEKYVEAEYPTELTRFSMAYKSVSIMDSDVFALDVLSMILGRGGSSRLHQRIYIDQKLVYSIYTSNYTPMDKGVFEIEATLERKNVKAAIAAVKKEIELVKKKGVNSSELKKIKKQAVANNIYGRELATEIAYHAAIDEAFSGDHNFSHKYVDGIKQVTNEDVIRVANKYLVDLNLTTAVLNPVTEDQKTKDDELVEQAGEVQKIVLDNKLTILLRENHASKLAVINIALNGGTRHEQIEKNGVCSLMTRLWTRETKSMGAVKLVETLESMGAELRPSSGRNSYGMSLKLLSADLEKGLDILADIINNPAFSQKEFTKEKKAMLAEIKTRNDHVFTKVGIELRRLLFNTHYFRLEASGETETLENLTLSDVKQFYEDYLGSDNMIISVFGDFDSETVLPILKKKFSKLKPRALTLRHENEEKPKTLREKEISIQKEQAVLMIGFQGPTVDNPDRYSIQLINSILGSALSGRMFNKIRDELGQAYTLGAGFVPGPDVGFIYFYVNTTAENVEKVKEVVFSQIEEIQNTDVTDVEITESKRYIRGTFEMGIERNNSLAFMTTLDELYGLGHDFYASYTDKIDNVTKEDIKRIATKYLNKDNAAVIIALPQEKITKQLNEE